MSGLNLSIVVELVDRFVKPARAVAGVSARMTDGLVRAHREMTRLATAKDAAAGFARMKKRALEATASWKQAEAEVRRLARAMKNGGDAHLARELEKARARAGALKREARQADIELERMRRRLREAGLGADGMARGVGRLSASLREAERRMQRLATAQARLEHLTNEWDRATQRAANAALIAGGMERVGHRMVSALTGPAEAAVSFEEAMADVRKVVNFDAPGQFRAMGRDILALSTRLPMAASGIAAIVAAAGQAGIARKDLMRFAEDAAKMGVAFDLPAEQAGRIMANWRAGLKLTQRETELLADAVNHLSNNMNAQAADLAQVISRVGGVAKAAGLATPQIASLGAALLSSGAGPEIAATALKNLTMALSAGDAATAMQKQALAALGFDAGSLAARMQTDAKGAILDVFRAMAALPAEQQSAALRQLFGLESVGAIAPLLTNLDNLAQAFRLTAREADYAGSAQAEYAVRAKTTANAMQLFRNRLDRLMIRFGERMLPALNRLMDGLAPIIDAIGGLAERFPTATSLALGMAGVLGMLALAIAPVITAVVSLSAALAWLRKSAQQARVAAMLDAAGRGAGKGGKGGWKGMAGRLAGAGRFLRGKGGMIGAGLAALDVGATLMSDAPDKAATVARDLGGIGGAMAGAAAGAAIGSVVPGIGTAIGGLIGSILGGMGGDAMGLKLAGLFDSDGKPTAIANQKPVIHQDNRATYQVHVNVRGGDPEAVKQAVREALAAREHEHAARFRSAAFDAQGAW